ncbi:hypothetical protein CKAH01_15104 [Colletotrichum kahawae]|uniref:Uncharacterized protein n=1 Tax=Colletotrichum kahawae TaxID=34407 RepID=A0AAD9YL74_COLKA|nr:hypothetical protein CKAH01_15104 [Colletotrichum kahawae]
MHDVSSAANSPPSSSVSLGGPPGFRPALLETLAASHARRRRLEQSGRDRVASHFESSLSWLQQPTLRATVATATNPGLFTELGADICGAAGDTSTRSA